MLLTPIFIVFSGLFALMEWFLTMDFFFLGNIS